MFESFIPKVSGYDITENIIMQSMGDVIKDSINVLSNYAIIKYFTAKKGVIIQLKVLIKIGNNNYKKVKIEGSSFVNIGDKINDPMTDGDRLGYLMGWGKCKNDVFDIFIDHFNKVSFEIK